MPLRTLTLVVPLVVLSLCASGWAQGGHLQRAHRNWDSQEYEAVIADAEAALKERAITRAQKIEALRLRGASHAVLGNDE